MGSGKTILSSALIKKGYEKVSFASYLKDVVSEIYSTDVELFKSEEGKQCVLEKPLIWSKKEFDKLFSIVGSNPNFDVQPKTFSTRREALQYIGTDVLKKFDKNFHAKKLIGSLNSNKNYVCDDLRFADELQVAQNSFETKSFHIIRPSNRKISNHVSETSLNWTYFDNILHNDDLRMDKKDFRNLFFKRLKKSKPEHNSNLNLGFLSANKFSAYCAGFIQSAEFDSTHYLRLPPKSERHHKFSQFYKITTGLCASKMIIAPFIIENLKLWEPEENGIPKIIENNQFLINCWNEGIRDGKNTLK